MKTSALKVTSICLSVLLIISVFIGGYGWHNYRLEQNRRARMNLDCWNSLSALMKQGQQLTLETVNDFCFLQNGIIRIVSDNISPDIKRVHNEKTTYVFSVHYNSFVMDLAFDDKKSSSYNKRLELLNEMNEEFYKITELALSCENYGDGSPNQLLNEKSELYQLLKDKIHDFGTKYTEKMQEYN